MEVEEHQAIGLTDGRLGAAWCARVVVVGDVDSAIIIVASPNGSRIQCLYRGVVVVSGRSVVRHSDDEKMRWMPVVLRKGDGESQKP